MVSFRHIKEGDYHILNVPELAQFRKHKTEFYYTKETSAEVFYQSTKDYFRWYLDYAKKIFGSKTFNEQQVSVHVFQTKIKTPHKFKEYCHKSIWASILYVQFLDSRITKENIQRYKFSLTDIDIELEWLITQFEVHWRKSIAKAVTTSGNRKNLTPTDIYSAARELFFIETSEIEALYLRDLKPVVMFQIRQLLELYGRNIIGYHTITNKDGVEIKKFTQEAWKFLKAEIKKGDSSRIEFPFDIDMIIEINEWSNSFVHSTYLYNSYIQHYALHVLGLLFIPPAEPIKTYDGKYHTKYNISEIRISKYDSLKNDFQEYLRSKSKDPNLKVEWLDSKDVGAYILTL